MPDETLPAAARSNVARASGSNGSAPPGHALRRARTVQDTPSFRRRSTANLIAQEASLLSPPSPDAPIRRSSNFSEYSLSDARGILNPQAQETHTATSESSSLASLSLAFALVPALAGALFQNGSAIATDVMLLGLAGIFLHWSVTQPWSWYHSAQSVRVQQEAAGESAIEDGSDLEDPLSESRPSTPLSDVQEEMDKSDTGARAESVTSQDASPEPPVKARRDAALKELYTYETLALLSCFLFPVASAYLLHTIRSQLSRPSEGLVSNYNLTIFLLVSELRVVSHILKLVQSRTLHLQKVVHNIPFEPMGGGSKELERLTERLERLEARSVAEEALMQQNLQSDSGRAKQEASISREVRNAIQSELDALNRAVRRYEKKATVLQSQTEARFAFLDARLGDAIALSAAAAKHSTSQRNSLLRLAELFAAIVLFPFNAMLHLTLLPFRSFWALLSGKKERPGPQRNSRAGRASKGSAQTRYNGDRVPTRVAKR
ncbi:hypothetical protein S7711_06020 [Stachybotrys chartarum IBT 7711]|uniref:Uncharacterized protein n=1 Tax=Stachybotrys chartarum (strain CBS 109288 / IBT 7711) TaxID=1280523 RepID=A0A084B2V0_STACB|nr:hypothetical protein S7711_06020 [Stachybotrys chartarum IBT 7711]